MSVYDEYRAKLRSPEQAVRKDLIKAAEKQKLWRGFRNR
jgi:hypothetical protein